MCNCVCACTYVSMHAEMYSVVIEEFVLALSVMCGLYM